MMVLRFLLVLALTYLAVAGSCPASLSGELYWKSMFPSTPMPKNLQNLLQPVKKKDLEKMAANFDYKTMQWGHAESLDLGEGIEPAQAGYGSIFLIDKDLRPGNKVVLDHELFQTVNKAPFLPCKVADSIPFSSNKYSDILRRFSVEPGSIKAQRMKLTIEECEAAAFKGEDKYCATSLVSLINWSVSRLGKNIKVIPNEMEKETEAEEFKIERVYNMGEKQVICHKKSYPYAVFSCHCIGKTDAYSVSLVGSDGTNVKAVAMCHKDTSAWNQYEAALQQLNVKPGTVPICHILPIEAVVWVPII